MGSLSLKNVTKRFGSTVAISNINLNIPEGEYWLLVGPSGCGKTTTLRVVAGHEDPTEGEVRLDGRLLNGIPPAERDMSTVFQHFALFPHKTVRENVEYGLKVQGVPRQERDDKVRNMLELVDLAELSDRVPTDLSGGQQQRVGLARALVVEPEVLLLDEPFGDLDRLLQIQMRAEIRRIQRELNRTFIHVTHNQEEALSMADQIVVINEGVVQQVASPVDVVNEPANTFVASFMGENNLLPTRVVDRDIDAVVLEDESGHRFTIEDLVDVPSVGAEGTLCVRASRTNIVSGEPDSNPRNHLPASVYFVEYIGDLVKVHLVTEGGTELGVIRTDEEFFRNPVSENEDVLVTWDPAQALFLDHGEA